MAMRIVVRAAEFLGAERMVPVNPKAQARVPKPSGLDLARAFDESTLTAFLDAADPATKPCSFGEADETTLRMMAAAMPGNVATYSVGSGAGSGLGRNEMVTYEYDHVAVASRAAAGSSCGRSSSSSASSSRKPSATKACAAAESEALARAAHALISGAPG